MSSSLIRVAVVGLGSHALSRHIPALRRNSAVKLVGVVDHHKDRAAGVASKYGFEHFAEAEELSSVGWLAEADALVIATPPAAHARQARAALELGKHVLIEKPFALSVAEGEAVVALAKEKQRTLAVNHNFLFSRGFGKLAKDLAKRRFGKIRSIAGIQFGNPKRRLPEWIATLPLGLFYDESPHFFYILQRVANGPLTLQYAQSLAAETPGTPAFLSLVYRDAANVPVTMDYRYDSAVSEWYVMVTGEQGLGIYDIYRDITMRLPNDGAHGLPQIIRTSVWAIVQHILGYVPNGMAYMTGRLDYGAGDVIDRFIQAIQGNNDALKGLSGEDALGVLKLQHEAVDAFQGKGRQRQ